MDRVALSPMPSGSSPGCGSQDVAALPRERSDAGGHGGRSPALDNRKSKPFRNRIILSSGTGARKAERPAKNCGAGHDGECCWSKSGQIVFRICWLRGSPESALGPYREARSTHSAGCTSIQCPSSHGADFMVLPSDDCAYGCGAGSKLSTSRDRSKPGSSPVRCPQCAHDRIEGIVHFGLLEAV
jgi:hypothetical protein